MVLKNQKGFGLIEIIISAIILISLAGLLLANFKVSQKEKELSLVTRQVREKIIDLEVRALAGSGLTLPSGEFIIPDVYHFSVKSNGYQILVNDNQLVEEVEWQNMSLSPVNCTLSFLIGSSVIKDSLECNPGQLPSSEVTINIIYVLTGENKQVILNTITGQLRD